ncbi:MAG: hypothetical protein EBX41_07555 [Chitinophagia bacterium]|nr:hypothetical protein [Chitinophagia bacterium]
MWIPHCYAQGELYRIKERYEDDPFDGLTYYSVGANYLSNNIYMGRRDSVRQPYYTVYAGIQMSLGFYISAGASYSRSRSNLGRFDLISVTGGYDNTFFKDRLLTGFQIEGSFYHPSSENIKGSITQTVMVYAKIKSDVIEPQITFTSNQASGADNIITFSADHIFRFLDNKLLLTPMVAFNYGSLHYYDDYLLKRFKKMDKNLVANKAIANAEATKPLDLELSGKATYNTNGWQFNFVPTIYLAFSPATVNAGNRSYKEKLKNGFTLECDICYRKERK